MEFISPMALSLFNSSLGRIHDFLGHTINDDVYREKRQAITKQTNKTKMLSGGFCLIKQKLKKTRGQLAILI